MAGAPTSAGEWETRSYYGADGKLRALQRYEQQRHGADDQGGSIYRAAGVWEEYRSRSAGASW